MFDSPASAGTAHTTAIALLALAFIFTPAVFVVSRSFGYLSVSLGIACMAICATFAWANWKKYTRLTVPPLSTRRAK